MSADGAPPPDIAGVRASCPVVVERPIATRVQLAVLIAATLCWPLAIGLMAREWPLWAQIPTAVMLLAGLVLLIALARHAQRAGAFRLAADRRGLYFREEMGGGVRALDWERCRHVEPFAHGERAVRFEFERDANEGGWTALCHAQVFLGDEDIEIVALDLPGGASALIARLEVLRAASSASAAEQDRSGGRAAA